MADITRTKADARPSNDIWTIEIVMDAAVEAGEWVYIKSNGKGGVASAGAEGTSNAIGVATMDCVAGRAVALATYGKFTGFSGMTPGALVYLSDTAGESSSTNGTVTKIVGISVSATDIWIDPRGGVVAAGAIGSTEIATGGVAAVDLASNAVTTAKILDANVTKGKLAGGFSKITLAAGTAAATDVTVSGMAVGDELVAVLSFTTAAAIASVANQTAEYVVAAGKLTKAAGTDESGNQLIIFWNDLT